MQMHGKCLPTLKNLCLTQEQLRAEVFKVGTRKDIAAYLVIADGDKPFSLADWDVLAKYNIRYLTPLVKQVVGAVKTHGNVKS